MNTKTLLGVRKTKVHKYMCKFYDALYDLCSILQQLDYTTVLHYNTAPTLSTNIYSQLDLSTKIHLLFNSDIGGLLRPGS